MDDLSRESVERLIRQMRQNHSGSTLLELNERIRATYPIAFNMFMIAVRTFLDKQRVREPEREKCLTAATAGFVFLMSGYEDQQPKRG